MTTLFKLIWAFSFTLLFFDRKAFSEDALSKVVFLKGQVTYLKNSLDNNPFIPLTKGTTLSPGDQVKTGPKSFVRLEIRDTYISLGPNGQLKIKETPKDKHGPQVLGLIKGRLRAKLNKKTKKDFKLRINTRTAAMGVRGTDFHFIFNDKNEISTIISYEGKVYLKKIDEFQDDDLDISKLEKQDLTIIEPGKVSSTLPGHFSASEPIKMSPIQFNALKNQNKTSQGQFIADKPTKDQMSRTPSSVAQEEVNEEEREKSESDQTVVVEEVTVEESSDMVGSSSSPHLLGSQDYDSLSPLSKPKVDKMRAGGYVDLETSLYIPPPKDSKYNHRERVFVASKKYGKVNKKTGEYIPPKGLKLDPLKGFKVVSDEIRGGIYRGLSSLAQTLNKPLKNKYLLKIHQFIKGNKYLSKLRFNGKTGFLYDSNVTQELYKKIIETTDVSSIIWPTTLELNFKKFFSKHWYYKTGIEFKNVFHMRRHISAVRKMDYQIVEGALELGKRGRLGSVTDQTRLKIEGLREYRNILPQKEYHTFAKHYKITLSELIRFDKHWVSKIEGAYTNYDGRYGRVGNIWEGLYSQIYQLSKLDYLNFLFFISTRERKDKEDNILVYQYDLKYYRSEVLQDTAIYLGAGYKLLTSGAEKGERGQEQDWFGEMELRRTWGNSGSLGFYYQYHRLKNKDLSRFAFEKHITGIAMTLHY